MMPQWSIGTWSRTLLVMVLIAGCGGGGSGGSGGSPAPATVTFNHARGFNAGIQKILPASDGTNDVYIVGAFTVYQGVFVNRFVRLHADQTIAQTYGNAFDNTVRDIFPAPDNTGDLYVVGNFTQYNGAPANGLVRLHRDGTRDTGFQLAAMDGQPSFAAPTVDGSGDIYVVGRFTQYGTTAIRHLIRLHADGTLNPSLNPGSGFGLDGEGNLGFSSLAVEPNGSGRLYVNGLFGSYNGLITSGLVRILPTGQADATFLGRGVNIDHALEGTAATVWPAQDGSRDIYIGGQFDQYNGQPVTPGLIRVHEDGSVDRTFTPPANTATQALVPVGPGTSDLYMASYTQTGFAPSTFTFRLLRIQRDGTIVSSFGDPQRLNGPVVAIAATTDRSGDAYAGGFFTVIDGAAVNYLARLQADGSLQPTTVRGSGFNTPVAQVSATGTGAVYVRVLASGDYDGTVVAPVVRLLPDGTLDGTFRFGTIRDTSSTTAAFITQMAPVRDGSGLLYVVGSFTHYNDQPVATVIRLFSDGTLDRAFATGTGFRWVNRPPQFSSLTVIVPSVVPADAPGGAIYAYGQFDRYNDVPVSNLVRLRSDGSVDQGFAIGAGFDDAVTQVVPAKDGSGRIYVSGSFHTFNGQAVPPMIRLLSTGQLDAGFQLSPIAAAPVQAMAATTENTVYVTSKLSTLMRLTPAGSADSVFAPLQVKGFVTQVLPLLNGQSIVAKDELPEGSTDFLVRLTNSGAADPSFVANTDNNVYSISDAGDGTGDLYVGGAFTRYQQQTMQSIARVDANSVPK